MRIALAQLTSTTDPATNLELVAEQSRLAAEGGAAVVVFPEATMCSFTRSSAHVAEAPDGPWAHAVTEVATSLGITIVVGMFTTATDGRVHNTVLVAGGATASYAKVHLFDALGFRESEHIAPGEELGLVDIEGTRVGLAICYDIRFPEQFITLARSGAQVIVVCASWAPGPNKQHQWRTLATARAMDSTAFVVAVDQAAVGDPEQPGRPTGVGCSMVIDPTGTPILELGTEPELAFVDIDPSAVDAIREALPVLAG